MSDVKEFLAMANELFDVVQSRQVHVNIQRREALAELHVRTLNYQRDV